MLKPLKVRHTHLSHHQFRLPTCHPSDGKLLELDFESNLLPGFPAKMRIKMQSHQ